ncbi:hypothetical protein KEM52_000714 [Ascosphaera acerosa]|nr:hypothetical protein KEM52_000714 [Ascosphaera acerosa]
MLARWVLPTLASSVVAATAQHVVSLSDWHWTVSNSNKSIQVPGSFPSQVHLDLLAAGIIPEPYLGNGDLDLRWVALENWTYSARQPQLHGAKRSVLVFDGLDTFATIELCGKLVGRAFNQFRQWTFDITDIVRSCSDSLPELSITFDSAVRVAEQIASQPGQETWPPDVEGLFEFPNRQFVRKEQSDFGWDWGPAFAPAGPWKPGYLVQFADTDVGAIYVLNTDIDIYREGQINHLPADQTKPWVVNASLDLIGDLPPRASLTITVTAVDGSVVPAQEGVSTVDRTGSSITGFITISPDLPELWWPHGLGDQNLYDIAVSVLDDDGRELAAVTKRSGFRTIFLNQLPISASQQEQGIAPGANWHFEVNGHEFYAKGSNLIPPDAFWPRVTHSYVSKLFDSVVAGNQNMLRVWASNIYLPDFVYDLADERGILLWSELQFGDALYPVDDDFLDNVREEIIYNVRRVNHHPSLALWAGGNELENLVLPLAYEGDPDHYDRYLHQYETLFISVAARLIYENTRSISYTPSSTNNGYLSIDFTQEVPFKERYQNVTPGTVVGNSDHYDYDSSHAFNLSTYPVGRFANEFGFHSMPSPQTWSDVLQAEDMWFNSTSIQLRNHHYPYGGPRPNLTRSAMGMGEMTVAVERYYGRPSAHDPRKAFSAWCSATQRFQAEYYKSQIQFYRRGSGRPERQLGSLYWQLEDIWQAPSWASIEYGGRWKMLHYTAMKAYQPVIVAPFWDQATGELNVTVISDLWDPISGLVSLTWFDVYGRAAPGNNGQPQSVPFEVGALNTTDILTGAVPQLHDEQGQPIFLKLALRAKGRRPNSDTTTVFTHEDSFMPSSWRDIALPDPQLSLSRDAERGVLKVRATTAVSFYTWLDHPKGSLGYFSDNAFVLLPGQEKEVKFHLTSDETHGQWLQGVTVSSLYDHS